MNQSFEIKPEERQSWGSIAAIWTGAMICIPGLMVGGMLGAGLSLTNVVIAILVGYGIVITYMCFMGMQGCDTGLPTVSVSASVLGVKGGKYLISVLLAIACIGWFAFQTAVCGASFSAMMSGIIGVDIPVWISSLFWGIVMTLTAMYGYNALKYLNYLAVPALIIVLVYGVYLTINNYEVSAILSNHQPQSSMSLVTGIGLVVGSFALGGVIAGDYSRYAKSRTDVIKSSVIGVFPSGLLVILLGAFMTIITGKFDITEVLTALGLPAFGLIALILATWTTNVTNAYSGGIAFANLLGGGEKTRSIMTGAAGLFGTILASFGIMNNFTDFLGILTAFIPPVAGVIMASYWIVGKGKKENFKIDKDFNINGIIAFAVGSVVAYWTGEEGILIGPINGIVVSMVLYIALNKLNPSKEKSAVTANN